MNFNDTEYVKSNRIKIKSQLDKINIMKSILEDDDVKNNIIK